MKLVTASVAIPALVVGVCIADLCLWKVIMVSVCLMAIYVIGVVTGFLRACDIVT